MSDSAQRTNSGPEVIVRLVEWASEGIDYEPDSPWGEITTDCAAAVDYIGSLQAENKRLRGRLEWVKNRYDLLPGEGQEETPTDWQYVAGSMRNIAAEGLD